jgi:hypothetical protein
VLIGGGGDNNNGSSPSADTSTLSSTATTGAQQQIENQINLTNTATKARAVAFIVRQSGERVLAISGRGFAPTKKRFFYAVWLYSSPTKASRLGFVGEVPSNGQFTTGADPSQLKGAEATRLRRQLASLYDYKEIVVTRETNPNTTKPGTIVASGQITQPQTSG